MIDQMLNSNNLHSALNLDDHLFSVVMHDRKTNLAVCLITVTSLVGCQRFEALVLIANLWVLILSVS